jgi:hypothetical protein
LFCLIGDPSRQEAILDIDEQNVVFVAPGQHVRLQIDERPGLILSGKVAQVAKIQDRHSLDASPVDVNTRWSEVATGQRIVYRARVELEADDHEILLGAVGTAKITVTSTSLAHRLYRVLRRTFAFQL